MSATSMAATVYDGSDVRLRRVPVPQPQQGSVLVRPTMTGLCGTDVHVAHGLHPRVRPPVVLGHEFTGVVAQATENWPAGQRVVVEPLLTCGACRSCKDGIYNRCPHLRILGIDVDGSLAELVSVPSHQLVAVPECVPDQAAALAEPLAVATHAVTALGAAQPDLPVLIFGGGPIGWLAAQVIRARGGVAQVVENNPFRQSMLQRAGISVMDAGNSEPGSYLAGIEASGTQVGLTTLISMSGPGAAISAVGLPKNLEQLDLMALISKEVTLRGSRVYTRTDVEAAITALASNVDDFLPLITHEVAFEEVATQGLGRIERAEPVGKILVRGLS